MTTAVAPAPPNRVISSRITKRFFSAMDRFDVVRFSDLTGPNGAAEWIRIGGGSFGVVYKGEYLGTPVAIKEVLPNNTYDVEKYFERECVLMKEARHPNIVQYIGLTRAPGHDGRIYIISEFVGGNVRSFIADKKRAFPWRLRMSFAIDIARALAYLHARNCMHRDLKGENLLITANERIKVCDFGFARIAARNDEEMRRMSYCGTDGYMSPEILMGADFSLPSDVFSLGVIFCEIAARHLTNSTTFARQIPSFGIDTDEIKEMADRDCPLAFIQLCIDCVQVEPERRPDMRQVVIRLRDIEAEIIAREHQEQGGTLKAVGSVRGASRAKPQRPSAGPRLPSFEGRVQVQSQRHALSRRQSSTSSSEGSDSDMEEALAQLEAAGIDVNSNLTSSVGTFKVSGIGNPWMKGGQMPEEVPSSWLPLSSETGSDKRDVSDHNVGASVIRPSTVQAVDGAKDVKAEHEPNVTASTVTVRPEERGRSQNSLVVPVRGSSVGKHVQAQDGKDGREAMQAHAAAHDTAANETKAPTVEQSLRDVPDTNSFLSATSQLSVASNFQPSNIYSPAPLYHRFTLVKNGTRRPTPAMLAKQIRGGDISATSPATNAWLPPAMMLANALSRCHVCSKRVGWKPFLDCDDCVFKCHVSCGELAEPTCQEMDIPGDHHHHHQQQYNGGRNDTDRSAFGLGRQQPNVGSSNIAIVTAVHAKRSSPPRSASSQSDSMPAHGQGQDGKALQPNSPLTETPIRTSPPPMEDSPRPKLRATKLLRAAAGGGGGNHDDRPQSPLSTPASPTTGGRKRWSKVAVP